VVPGGALRWVTGLVVAAVLALAGVASLLVGVAVAVARETAGAGATEHTDDGATVRVRFAPDDDGTTTEAEVDWTATEAPSRGEELTVAFDPGDPAREPRPFEDVDPTGGWAAEWHPVPWYAGGGLGAGLALLTVVVTSRWVARATRSPRR
jgi:hypothetical protein